MGWNGSGVGGRKADSAGFAMALRLMTVWMNEIQKLNGLGVWPYDTFAIWYCDASQDISCLSQTPPMPLNRKTRTVKVIAPFPPGCPPDVIYQGFAVTDLIWNVAPGNSEVSACTVALIPILARAPLIIPQGNHRNCI